MAETYILLSAAFDALAPFCKTCRFSINDKNCIYCPHGHTRIKLNTIPAADVRPVIHGKWLKPKFPYAWYKCECNQCGYKAPDSGWTLEPYEMDHGEKLYRDFIKDHPFCTRCGADMREVKTE